MIWSTFIVSLSTIFIVGLITSQLRDAQKSHYEFVNQCKNQHNYVRLSEELQKKLKEFDDYKKKVDGLTLKAGFKL